MPYTEMGTCVPLDQATTASRCRHARECDPREEPYALARTYGSVRGAWGNPGPYRDQYNLVNPFHLTVTVAHYPSGASKWNPIEHRLFSEVSKNWAGVPLESMEVILNYLNTTKTQTGLTVTAKPMARTYECGLKISPDDMKQLHLKHNEVIPRWNYTIKPQ